MLHNNRLSVIPIGGQIVSVVAFFVVGIVVVFVIVGILFLVAGIVVGIVVGIIVVGIVVCFVIGIVVAGIVVGIGLEIKNPGIRSYLLKIHSGSYSEIATKVNSFRCLGKTVIKEGCSLWRLYIIF